jgi:predicted Fe-Mo cluster-binding NifX family protein
MDALHVNGMERIAIPVWEGRVSPVLDTAERLWICDIGAEPQRAAHIVNLQPADIRQRMQFIRGLGIHTLLCGAISRQLHNLLLGAGIEVRPWLTGDVEDIAAAYSEGRLTGDRFLLPGWRQRRQRGRFGRNRRNRS